MARRWQGVVERAVAPRIPLLKALEGVLNMVEVEVPLVGSPLRLR